MNKMRALKLMFGLSLLVAVVGGFVAVPVSAYAGDLEIGDCSPTNPDCRPMPMPYYCANSQHWDKIIFMITNKNLAERLQLPFAEHLDIKVLDDPKTVADLKGKVIDFLHSTMAPPHSEIMRKDIRILEVKYAIACPAAPMPHPTDPST